MIRNFLIFLVILMSCNSNLDSTEELKTFSYAMESWDSEIKTSHNGKPNLIVQAGHIYQFQNGDTIYFEKKVCVNVFDVKNNRSMQMLADMAKLNRKTDSMTASGSVEAKTDSGLVLFTRRLHYDTGAELIHTQDSIIFLTELDTLRGVGFQSDIQMENWHIVEPTGKTKRHE